MTAQQNSAGQTEQATKPEPSAELEVWLGLLQQVAAAGADIAELLQLELRLALGDSGRLLILALVFVFVLMLGWVGLSSLLAWLCFHITGSTTLGLVAFVATQLLALLGIREAWSHYRKSLSLPLTRQHLQALVGGQSGDSQIPEQ
jgi:hypothetical protein